MDRDQARYMCEQLGHLKEIKFTLMCIFCAVFYIALKLHWS